MIGRVFQRFLDFFYVSSSGTDSDELECRVDVDAMARSLRLEKQARRSAEHELPASNARYPDSTERKIETLIQKRMLDLTNRANQILIGYNTTLSGTDLNAERQRMNNLAETTRLRLDSRLAEAEQELRAMKVDLQRSNQALRRFQLENRRETDAEYPLSRLYHYSLVLLILLFEALANGYFFARGSELGMLGGISQSLVIAVLNIVPSFLIAGMVFLRYTNHVSVITKLAAWIAVFIHLLWATGFNLCVAHYRDLIVYGNEDAIQAAIGHTIGNPFGLADLNSWLLWLMGMLFSIVAMIDGYKNDDPYPGYGRLQRSIDERQEDFDNECGDLASEALAIRDRFLEELETLSENARSAFSYQRHLFELKPVLAEKHKHCMDVLNKSGDALVHQYRSINAMHRKTPVPEYFNRRWTPEKTFDLVGADVDEHGMDVQKILLEQFPEVEDRIRNEIEQNYSLFLARVRNIEPGLAQVNEVNETTIF